MPSRQSPDRTSFSTDYRPFRAILPLRLTECWFLLRLLQRTTEFGWLIREDGSALGGADGEREQLAVPQQGQRRRDRRKVKIDPPGHHFCQGFGRAFEGNVHGFEARARKLF